MNPSNQKPEIRNLKPVLRPRRLRQSDALRRLVRETSVSVDNLIAPIFVIDVGITPTTPTVIIQPYNQFGYVFSVNPWCGARLLF